MRGLGGLGGLGGLAEMGGNEKDRPYRFPGDGGNEKDRPYRSSLSFPYAPKCEYMHINALKTGKILHKNA